MPYHVAQSSKCPTSKPWACINSGTGKVMGCHPSKADAAAQMAALYANEPGASMSDCGCVQLEDAEHHTRASVDDTAWDGNAAMTACNDASCYRAICAGRRVGDPSLRSTWALPHHKSPGSAPSADGVRNALSRLPQTQGLVNKQEAQHHLERHLATIQAQSQNSDSQVTAEAAQRRAQAATAGQLGALAVPARSLPFASQMRAQTVTRDGQQLYQVEGYASVFERGYEMWDLFGPYTETVASGAFDRTLAANPDVAFLVNHRGVTMARTTNGTLELSADGVGLKTVAYLNPKRQDVRDLVTAIEDRNITEMSFAFMLPDGAGQWSDDFDQFRINEVDIDRGDTSAVNYGASPHTSIAARQREILADLDHLPAGAARAALARLQHRDDLAPVIAPPVAGTTSVAVLDQQMAEGTGRRVSFVEALLEI